MEINNSSHFSTDAYLLSQRKYQAKQSNVSPLEKAHKDQQSDSQTNKTEPAVEDISKNAALAVSAEQSSTEITNNPFSAINLTRAHQTNSNQHDSSYKVTAHKPQIGHQAEQAVAQYNRVENSQYGQELVSRIELLV